MVSAQRRGRSSSNPKSRRVGWARPLKPEDRLFPRRLQVATRVSRNSEMQSVLPLPLWERVGKGDYRIDRYRPLADTSIRTADGHARSVWPRLLTARIRCGAQGIPDSPTDKEPAGRSNDFSAHRAGQYGELPRSVNQGTVAPAHSSSGNRLAPGDKIPLILPLA